jgi:TonB family protein
MKTKIIFLLLIMSSITALGQNAKTLEGYSISAPVFTGVPTVVPVNPDQKYTSIEAYLKEIIVFPEEARERYIQGTEVIGFVVTPQGRLSDFRIINSLNSAIDEEVIRALLTTNGMWEPGKIEQEKVSMESEVSITFVITDMSHMNFNDLAKKYFSRATVSLFSKHDFSRALRNFDKGIVLLPNDKSLLLLRGMTRFELGDKEGALKDWTRIKTLGGLESEEYIKMCSSMNGYEQMSQVLEK